MKQEPFSERQLDKAAQQAFAAMLENLPPPSEYQHTFSPEFETKMAKLCAREKRHSMLRRISKRAAMIALTCLVGTGSFLAVNTEARAAFTGWFKSQYETFISFRFSGEVEPAALAMLPMAEYRPQQLPDGYEENGWSATNTQVSVEYLHESSKLLSFGYIPEAQSLGWTAKSWELDLSDAVHTQTKVSGAPADLFSSSTPDTDNFLMWTSPVYDTAFSLSGPLSGEELIEIAESVTISNLDELPPLEEGQAPVFEPLYQLTTVPEGYERKEYFGDQLTCTTVYVNPDAQRVVFFDSYYTHSGIGVSISMEKDEHECESVRVGSLFGEFYRSTVDKAPNLLMWIDEDAGIAFHISGFLEKDEMLCMAKSVIRTR